MKEERRKRKVIPTPLIYAPDENQNSPRQMVKDQIHRGKDFHFERTEHDTAETAHADWQIHQHQQEPGRDSADPASVRPVRVSLGPPQIIFSEA